MQNAPACAAGASGNKQRRVRGVRIMRTARMFLTALSFLIAGGASAAPAVLLERARLVPGDGAPDGGFGRAMAIDGNVAVVTANPMSAFWGASPDSPGAAYVYERAASGTWRQTAKLTSPAGESDLFGIDVAVEGNVIVVGAAFHYRAYVFEKLSGVWTQTAVLGGEGSPAGDGFSVSIANGVIAVNDNHEHGIVFYHRVGSGWERLAACQNGLGESDGDYLGPRVDLSPRFAIHGSWGSDFEPQTPSTAYIYDAGAAGDWTHAVATALPQPGVSYPTGFSDYVAIGSTDSFASALISGFVFIRDASGHWTHTDNATGARTLSRDGKTIVRHRGSGAGATFRLDSNGHLSHVATLATSDGGQLRASGMDVGRIVAVDNAQGVYTVNSNAAYIYELPDSLVRPPLQQDDFQDGDAAGWSTTPGSMFAVVNGGTSRVYRQTSLSGNSAAFLQTTSGNDQSIQADITPRAFDGADRWVGLVARYSNANNYYYVTARSSGVLQLKKMVGGAFTTLAAATLPIGIGTTSRLRLEAIGDHVRVLVDNKPVMRVRDSSLSSGVPGLMMYKASADFDNIVFNPNPASVAASALPLSASSGNWSAVTVDGVPYARQSDVSGPVRAVTSELLSSYGFDTARVGMHGDQIVQANLRPIEFSGPDRWVGLVARYVDDANYHYVTLRDSNSVWLRKVVNGVPQTFATAPLDVRPNVTYRVRLESVGTRLRVYVNGSLLLETSDSNVPQQPTGAGVAMYKTAADVGNFLVLNP
jgi:hypothetical protein